MKTYEELECEAYITGNTTLAKLYAKLANSMRKLEEAPYE